MCGIACFCGNENGRDICMSMLSKLEYRGYDSSGICLKNNDNFTINKALGQISNLKKILSKTSIDAPIAIAHTRWATHGGVTLANAHPHTSENWAIVHNGIIENYAELKKTYNLQCQTETDTEVIVRLLEKTNDYSLAALINVAQKLKGSFALVAINKTNNKVLVAKRNSQIFIGQNKNNFFIASDVYAFANYANEFYSLNDGEFALIENGRIEFADENNAKLIKSTQKLKIDNYKAETLQYKHYMLKEIEEIPRKVQDLKHMLMASGLEIFDIIKKIDLSKIKKICLVGCGTAYHSALVGEKMLEKSLKKIVKTFYASEFSAVKNISTNTLCIFVSQSGETFDTIESAKHAKNLGAHCIAITNVIHSTLAGICDDCIPVGAGVEIAVASTKAYVMQIVQFQLIAKCLSCRRKRKFKRFVNHYLDNLSQLLSMQIKNFKNEVFKISKQIKKYKKIIFIGRGVDFVAASEGSLKFKELTYIPSQSVPSGELKHGHIALIDKKSLVIQIATISKDRDKNKLTRQEILARGGNVLTISASKTSQIKLLHAKEYFYPILSIIPLQFLAYKASVLLRHNPDMPRNLAKSVTVQ